MNAELKNSFNDQIPLTDIFKALGDETRFSILNMVIRHNICAKSIACRLKLSESAVSQHLKILRDCALITGEKRGYWVHYSVNFNKLSQIVNDLNILIRNSHSDLKQHTDNCPNEMASL